VGRDAPWAGKRAGRRDREWALRCHLPPLDLHLHLLLHLGVRVEMRAGRRAGRRDREWGQ
jgi:hypothetical protein